MENTIETLKNEVGGLNAKMKVLKQEYNAKLLAFIKAVVEKHGGSIYFNSREDFYDEYQMSFGSVTITYDGGRHPEYASNAYSEVGGVFIKDGELYVDCDDCDSYDFSRIWSVDEIEAVADALRYYDEYIEENPEEEE